MVVAKWCCNVMLRAIFLAILLIGSAPAWAQIYKWVDESGVVHYSSRPVEGQQSEDVTEKVHSTGNFVEMAIVETAVAGDILTMLSTTWCKVCKRAKAYLNAKGIAFIELDVEKDDEGKRRYKELNGKGVPIILIGKQRMNGFSEAKMEAMLKKAGLI